MMPEQLHTSADPADIPAWIAWPDQTPPAYVRLLLATLARSDPPDVRPGAQFCPDGFAQAPSAYPTPPTSVCFAGVFPPHGTTPDVASANARIQAWVDSGAMLLAPTRAAIRELISNYGAHRDRCLRFPLPFPEAARLPTPAAAPADGYILIDRPIWAFLHPFLRALRLAGCQRRVVLVAADAGPELAPGGDAGMADLVADARLGAVLERAPAIAGSAVIFRFESSIDPGWELRECLASGRPVVVNGEPVVREHLEQVGAQAYTFSGLRAPIEAAVATIAALERTRGPIHDAAGEAVRAETAAEAARVLRAVLTAAPAPADSRRPVRVRASNHGGRDDGLRIGVVAPPHRTGSAERFLREVVLGLASHASRPTVTLYTRHDDGTAQGDATHDGLLDLGGRVREVERDGIDAVLEADFDQLDVIWCTWPHFRSPPISRLPIVTTLHDLNWRSFWSLSPKQAEQLETEMPLWIAASTLFVSSSEFIRGQLCHEYGLVHSHTRVIPLTGMRPLEVSPEAVTAVRKRYCLPSRFFLFPAVRSPHKNFVGVERALELLRAEGKPVTVVATSEHTDWYHGPDLLGLGYVSNETLRALYELSEGVLMPTLYEAGSFPIFEAMLVGKPVACSSIPPIVEQIERDHAVAEFFNPLDPADIAAALRRLTRTSRRKRAAIVKHNREAVGRRGWADVAGGYLDVFAEAVALSVGAP